MEELYQKVKDLCKQIKEDYSLEDFLLKYDLDSCSILGLFVHKESRLNKYGKPLIRLNKHLLEEFGDVYIDETVKHELAHLIMFTKYPTGFRGGTKHVQPHGREWKAICRKLGMKTISTKSSTYTDSKFIKNKSPYIYKCSCGEHNVTKQKHNNMIGVEYNCGKCKGILEFVGIRYV